MTALPQTCSVSICVADVVKASIFSIVFCPLLTFHTEYLKNTVVSHFSICSLLIFLTYNVEGVSFSSHFPLERVSKLNICALCIPHLCT